MISYLLSRLKQGLTSPAKFTLFAYIILRYPVLYAYYRLRSVFLHEYASLKKGRALSAAEYQNGDPLISVVIATYNRAEILKERALKSVLAQTYQNFEVIVVGDGCTDNTEEEIASLNDSRIRFFNIQERGKYPTNPRFRWYVAGTPPANFANEQSRGLWLAHLDDDEIFTPDHLEKLLRFAQQGNYEFVYSIVRQEQKPGVWVEVGKTPIVKYLFMNHCGHSTTLWRRYLNAFQYDIRSWRLNVPVDLNRWSRLKLAGIRFGFLPEISSIAPLRPGTTMFAHQSEDRV